MSPRRTSQLFALRNPLPRMTSLFLGFVMPAVVLGAWCIASYGGLAPPDFLPSPSEVVRGTLQLFLEYDLARAILISTQRIGIAFLCLGVFVYLLPVVVTAIRAVPDELVQTGLTLGASRLQVIRTILLPAALPEIFDSFRVMNAIAWTYVILAEAVNAQGGLGYMVQLAYQHQKASWSFAGLLVIGGIGLLTDGLIRMVSGVLFRWREKAA